MGREAVERFRQRQPDFTLMDLSMPVMGGPTRARVLWSHTFVGIVHQAVSSIGALLGMRRSVRKGLPNCVSYCHRRAGHRRRRP